MRSVGARESSYRHDVLNWVECLRLHNIEIHKQYTSNLAVVVTRVGLGFLDPWVLSITSAGPQQ